MSMNQGAGEVVTKKATSPIWAAFWYGVSAISALLGLSFIAAGFWFIWAGGDYPDKGAVAIGLIGAGCIYLSGCYVAFPRKAPPSTPEQLAASRAKAAAQDAFLRQWWVRYPCAVVAGLIGTYGLGQPKLLFNLAGVLWLLGAVYLARELGCLVLALGLVAAMFYGIAALPVSVAIVLGAVIIVAALR